ncbi:MAG: glycerate kinase [Gemmatimonadota bacterium]|nr:glycerate kinase [Gemmatimonadota bacterium]
MRIILAPDSFKGTFPAIEVCRAFETGIRAVLPDAQVKKLPLADGGEGTLDVLLGSAGGRRCRVQAADPTGRGIEVDYAVLSRGNEALVEMARVSGLELLSGNELNPWKTGTYGLGQVVGAALEEGVEGLALTLGGSATVDGGVGMARALGFRFLDSAGEALELEGGRILGKIARIDTARADRRLEHVRARALCDVTNPLLGPRGAAQVFGPQKGADPEMVERLEAGLANLASRIGQDLGLEIAGLPGSGAAGGLGAAVAAFLGGGLVSGIDYVLDAVQFNKALEGADLVITGEGSFDSQSLGGKVISGVLERAKAKNVPVAVVCGVYKQGDGAAAESTPLPVKIFSGSDLAGTGAPPKLVDFDGLAALAGMAAERILNEK